MKSLCNVLSAVFEIHCTHLLSKRYQRPGTFLEAYKAQGEVCVGHHTTNTAIYAQVKNTTKTDTLHMDLNTNHAKL